MSLRRMVQTICNDANYVDDYTAPTWSLNSFDFATNNIFSGDSTISTTLNNAIVGSNKQWTLSLRFKRKTPLATTQILFCRDKSSATSARQIVVFFNASNKLVVTVYTNSTNSITFTSTDSFADTRSWNEIAIVYDGTQATVTNRITAYKNGFTLAGATVQTGTFTTINNITSPNVNIGGRSDAANFSSTKINQIALFSTNLSSANVRLLHNNRVPFDIRTNATLNANLVMFLNPDYSTSFSTNWTWTDLVGGGVFTSSGMVVGDKVADAPALKQITVNVLIGQSNAVGRVPLASLESKYVGSLSWLKVFDGTNFVNINSTTNNNQYNDAGSEYGIEYYLGDKLNKLTEKTQYIFKYTVGGTYLSPLYTPSWCVPTPVFQPSGGINWQQIYNNELPDLYNWEQVNGYTITKINVIWIQGEADSLNLDSSTTYETNLTNFYASIIDDRMKGYFFVQPKVIDTLLSANQTLGTLLYKGNVNTAKQNVAALDTTNYTTVNTDTVTVKVDLVHFDKQGMITLANSVANKIIAFNNL